MVSFLKELYEIPVRCAGNIFNNGYYREAALF